MFTSRRFDSPAFGWLNGSLVGLTRARAILQAIQTPLHTSTATAVGGRAGRARNGDGVIDVKLSLPKTLGGEGVQPGTTTPEDLFAAGYAACFGGAANLVAGKLKLKPTTLGIHSSVTIGRTADSALQLKVVLNGHFTGVTQEEAMRIMETAHNVCPYSHATRGNVDVVLKVTMAELKQ